MELTRNMLISYAIKYRGEYTLIKQAIMKNEVIDEYLYSDAITILDSDYPQGLKRLANPPFVLFFKGNKNLLNKTMVTVIGRRNSNQIVNDYAKDIDNFLNKEYVIVSGLAIGCDEIIHRSCLKHQKIALIPCGIDIVYPKRNQDLYELIVQDGLIISEYPPGVIIEKYRLLSRNRIMVALANKLIVLELNQRGGSNYSVDIASDLSIDTYCFVKGYDDPSYNNELINQGVNMIYNRESILEI